MNINECGCRPYGWLGLDGNRCIRVIPRHVLVFIAKKRKVLTQVHFLCFFTLLYFLSKVCEKFSYKLVGKGSPFFALDVGFNPFHSIMNKIQPNISPPPPTQILFPFANKHMLIYLFKISRLLNCTQSDLKDCPIELFLSS